MNFSRHSPSTRYLELMQLYRRLHDEGERRLGQYNPTKIAIPGEGDWDSVIDCWDVDEVCCYDPCYPPYCKQPEGKFDGVMY